MSKDTRVRGKRASREKLEQAMLDAGFTNQVALAAQIAMNEKTNKIPKDMVSKVFREHKMSLRNLTRVAVALGVSVDYILKVDDDAPTEDEQASADEVAGASAIEPDNAPSILASPTSRSAVKGTSFEGDEKALVDKSTKPNEKTNKKPLAAISVAAIISLLLIVLLIGINTDIVSTDNLQEVPAPKLENYRIVIKTAPANGVSGTETARLLSSNDRISSVYPDSKDTNKLSILPLLERYDSDAVLHIEILGRGYYRKLLVKLVFEELSFELAHTILVSSQSHLLPSFIAQQVKNLILVDGGEKPENNNEIALFYGTKLSDEGEAIRQTVMGLNMLYAWSGPQDSEKAKSRFYSAIELDPKLSIPYAGLCIAYVRARYVENETTWLELAKTQCTRAQQLEKDGLMSVLANTYYMTVQGEHEKARALLTQHMPKYGTSALFKTQLAYVSTLLESPDSTVFAAAQTMMREAIEQAPDYYSAYEALGTSYLYQGNALLALNTFEAADKETKNAIGLSNLSTFQFCFKRLDAAANTLERLIKSNPNHYAGYENLARVNLVRRDYEKAYALMHKAIDKEPNIRIHQVLSFFADIAVAKNEIEEGLDFYRQAIELVENDVLLGSATDADQVSKLWYRWEIAKLTEQAFVEATANKAEFFEKLNAFEQSPALGLRERRLLALMYFRIEQVSQGKEVIDAIIETCPVYELMKR